MKIKTIAAAAALAVMTATSGFAATLDFNFTVTKGTQTLSGVVRGLIENASSGATEITFFATLQGNVDTTLTPGFSNSYTVVNSEIVAYNATGFSGFGSFDINSDPGGQFNPLPPAINVSFASDGKFLNGAGTTIAFATGVVVEDPGASTVPLPAGGLLLLTGLAALQLRKKRAA